MRGHLQGPKIPPELAPQVHSQRSAFHSGHELVEVLLVHHKGRPSPGPEEGARGIEADQSNKENSANSMTAWC